MASSSAVIEARRARRHQQGSAPGRARL